MNERVKITVVIPAYNVAKYIGKTLDSTINQTFEDYEVVVVDDGSKDDTGAICDKYAAENEKIIAIHQENGGVMAARLNGVAHSRGEWVTFLDGDDRLPENSLSCLFSYTSDQIDVVWGVRGYVNENGRLLRNEIIRFSGVIGTNKYQEIISRNPKSLHGMLYRKKLLDNPIVIDRKIVNNEDQIFNLFLSPRVRYVYGTKEIVHHYLIRQDSVSKKQYTEDYWYMLLAYLKENYEKYYVSRYIYNKFALSKIYSLIRNRNYYNFEFSQNCFIDFKYTHYSFSLGLKGNLALFVIKEPSSFIIRLMRFYPRLIWEKMVKR